MKNHNCQNEKEDCAFMKMIRSFGWFTIEEDGEDYICMPYLNDNENFEIRYRVNYCPSCGMNVRDITLPLEEY